jgi:hypothetical protein
MGFEYGVVEHKFGLNARDTRLLKGGQNLFIVFSMRAIGSSRKTA